MELREPKNWPKPPPLNILFAEWVGSNLVVGVRGLKWSREMDRVVGVDDLENMLDSWPYLYPSGRDMDAYCLRE